MGAYDIQKLVEYRNISKWRSGYYNVTGSFMKNLGIHFAIGYPF